MKRGETEEKGKERINGVRRKREKIEWEERGEKKRQIKRIEKERDTERKIDRNGAR